MSKDDVSEALPFWRHKRLEEMNPDEWDLLCDRCGRCCLSSLRADDTRTVYSLDLGCSLQDTATGGCSDYANRKTLVPSCIQLTAANVRTLDVLPPTCGYVRVHRGQDLEWWHPLVSGDPMSVIAAGMSAAGRFVEPRFGGVLEYHTVDWPMQAPGADPRDNWQRAMFGGVNASIPTPFRHGNQMDLDLMAEHCFWLLSNGCQGLAVLDKAGEVASLTIAERIAVLEGLLSRGVPASKILAGIGPASLADGARIASCAQELGIRGVMTSVSVPDRVLPGDVLSESLRALLDVIPNSLHIYLSFMAAAGATAACVSALDVLMVKAPGRLKGIRDEAPGCHLAMVALDRLESSELEVYIADETMLSVTLPHGGAGLIGPGANLLGPHCAAIVRDARPEQTVAIQRSLDNAAHVLRSGPVVPGIKALLARHTGRPEWGRSRLPLRPPTASKRMALFRSFDACGITLRRADRKPVTQ